MQTTNNNEYAMNGDTPIKYEFGISSAVKFNGEQNVSDKKNNFSWNDLGKANIQFLVIGWLQNRCGHALFLIFPLFL